MGEVVKISKHIYKQKPDDTRSTIQILHEIVSHMQLNGFRRGRTTIFEVGPVAKIEYGIYDPARFGIKKANWFRRKKTSSKIELKLELRHAPNNNSSIEVISELRELSG